MNLFKKQILILFFFSVAVSAGSIIHGIFMDLDFSQIKRLTFEGFLFTFFIVFPSALFLEWVFDLNNKKEILILKKRIEVLEKNNK